MTDYMFALDCENGDPAELSGGPLPIHEECDSLEGAIRYGEGWASDSGRDGTWTSGVARLTIFVLGETGEQEVYRATLGHVRHLGSPLEA